VTGLPASARDQLSQLNPGFILPGAGRDAGPDWVAVTALLAGTPRAGHLLDQALGAVARRLQTTESWIAASILFQGWAARLTSLYAGTIILGTSIPDLSASRVQFRVGSAGRVQLTMAELVPVDAVTGWHQLYDGHLDPATAGARARTLASRTERTQLPARHLLRLPARPRRRPLPELPSHPASGTGADLAGNVQRACSVRGWTVVTTAPGA
jgi:hypothetical protein